MLKIEPHLASDLNQERQFDRFKIILGSTVKSINGYFGTNFVRQSMLKNETQMQKRKEKSSYGLRYWLQIIGQSTGNSRYLTLLSETPLQFNTFLFCQNYFISFIFYCLKCHFITEQWTPPCILLESNLPERNHSFLCGVFPEL